jgi:hypothetical protein
MYNASTAVCVIDVAQAAEMLGRAGTSLNAAVKVCVRGEVDNKTQSQIARCASPVAGVIESFSYSASFLSQAAKECSESLHIKDFMKNMGWDPSWIDATAQAAEIQAACAGAVTGFTAALAQIADSGAAVTTHCESELIKYFPGLAGDQANSASDRRLQAANADAAQANFTNQTFLIGDSKKEIRQQQEAECAFDIGQTTLFLANAGTQINSAVFDCSDYRLREGGRHAKAMCAVDSAGVIRSFGFVASLISFAVTNCPAFHIDLDAACSGAIAEMVTGIAGLAASGSGFSAACEPITNATRAVFGI